VFFTSSEIDCGVHEKRPKLRNTVNKIKAIFFILYDLKIDTSVAVRMIYPEILSGNTLVLKGVFLSGLRSVECRSKARGYFSIWPVTLRCNSSGCIEMFCKPCYTQGGIAIQRQMKKEWLGKFGKKMESLWKRISKYFPADFCSFKALKNR
jgi:hypothetical protein